MSKLKGACIIGQSGGPTSVINASALGVIETALKNTSITRVLGAEHGIVGVLNDRLFDMGQEDPAELSLLWPYSPGGMLIVLTAAQKGSIPPTPSIHRLQCGLPGYLILFAPHTFAPQRQLQSS